MKFISTRGKGEKVHFSKAIQNSLALDGGLYIPDEFPQFGRQVEMGEKGVFTNWKGVSGLVEVGARIMEPWLHNDGLLSSLKSICEQTFIFPTPLVFVESDTAVLELFHGPTAAFKDFGAKFLAECLGHLQPSQPKLVLVATSGDTGGAVAAAFRDKPNIQVIILYPYGKVTPLQEKQLTTWGKSVRAYAVQGTFDDCQILVKKAFSRQNARQNANAVYSANSISIGRLLPQVVYYATSSLEYFNLTGQVPGFIVPTGNLGNAVAALWAKRIGFPIREVVLATNTNRAIWNYLKTGFWEPFPTVATVANAMDVGNPSNIERLVSLYPSVREMRQEVSAVSVSDSDIAMEVTWTEKTWNRVVCPHTATAVHARRGQKKPHWIVVATAHPAKFESILRPWIQREIEMPESLSQIRSRTSEYTQITSEWTALQRAISECLGTEF